MKPHHHHQMVGFPSKHLNSRWSSTWCFTWRKEKPYAMTELKVEYVWWESVTVCVALTRPHVLVGRGEYRASCKAWLSAMLALWPEQSCCVQPCSWQFSWASAPRFFLNIFVWLLSVIYVFRWNNLVFGPFFKSRESVYCELLFLDLAPWRHP